MVEQLSSLSFSRCYNTKALQAWEIRIPRTTKRMYICRHHKPKYTTDLMESVFQLSHDVVKQYDRLQRYVIINKQPQ